MQVQNRIFGGRGMLKDKHQLKQENDKEKNEKIKMILI